MPYTPWIFISSCYLVSQIWYAQHIWKNRMKHISCSIHHILHFVHPKVTSKHSRWELLKLYVLSHIYFIVIGQAIWPPSRKMGASGEIFFNLVQSLCSLKHSAFSVGNLVGNNVLLVLCTRLDPLNSCKPINVHVYRALSVIWLIFKYRKYNAKPYLRIQCWGL